MAEYSCKIIEGGSVLPASISQSTSSLENYGFDGLYLPTMADGFSKGRLNSTIVENNKLGFEAQLVLFGPLITWAELAGLSYTWAEIEALGIKWSDWEPGGRQLQIENKLFTDYIMDCDSLADVLLYACIMVNTAQKTAASCPPSNGLNLDTAKGLAQKAFLVGDYHIDYYNKLAKDFVSLFGSPETTTANSTETARLALHTSPSQSIFNYASYFPIRLLDSTLNISEFTKEQNTKSSIGIDDPQFIIPEGQTVNLSLIADYAIRLFLSSILYKHVNSSPGFDATDVLLFPINWDSGIKETFGWLTDIITSYDGTEQRISLREFPKWALTLHLLACNAAESNKIDSFFWKRSTQVIGVPLWTDATTLKSDVFGGSYVMYVNDLEYLRFDSSPKLILYRDEDNFEIVSIKSCIGDKIELSGATMVDWPADGTIVMPLVSGRIPETFTINRATSEVSDISVNIDIEVVRK